MAAIGLLPEDVAEQTTFEVFPDNWQAVSAFDALSTQWRTGFSGPTGLDYNAVPFVLRMLRVPRAEWPDLFSDLRVMEEEALKMFNESKKDQ